MQERVRTEPAVHSFKRALICNHANEAAHAQAVDLLSLAREHRTYLCVTSKRIPIQARHQGDTRQTATREQGRRVTGHAPEGTDDADDRVADEIMLWQQDRAAGTRGRAWEGLVRARQGSKSEPIGSVLTT